MHSQGRDPFAVPRVGLEGVKPTEKGRKGGFSAALTAEEVPTVPRYLPCPFLTNLPTIFLPSKMLFPLSVTVPKGRIRLSDRALDKSGFRCRRKARDHEPLELSTSHRRSRNWRSRVTVNTAPGTSDEGHEYIYEQDVPVI